VGLSLPIDGSSDHELDIKDFENLEIGNWEEDLESLDDGDDVPIESDEEIELVAVDIEEQ